MMLGIVEPVPHPGGGELWVKNGIFEEARVNERIDQNAPKIPYGSIKYVVFPLDRLREMAAEGITGSASDFHYSYNSSRAKEDSTEPTR
jgi:hypothetical protein